MMSHKFILTFLLSISFFCFINCRSQPQAESPKSQDIYPSFPSSATNFFYNKCVAFTQSFSINSKMSPVCSIEEFVQYPSNFILKMDSQKLQSLPPFYFESLRPNQATSFNPNFINKLSKAQAEAFPLSVEDVLSPSARKTLNKIKKQLGLVSRITIMSLAALTAFILFKYS